MNRLTLVKLGLFFGKRWGASSCSVCFVLVPLVDCKRSRLQSKADNVSPVSEIDWAHYEAELGSDVVGPMKVRVVSIITVG